MPGEEHLAGLNFGYALGQKTHNRFTGERLSAAGFSDETEQLSALAEVEADTFGGKKASVVSLNLDGKLGY